MTTIRQLINHLESLAAQHGDDTEVMSCQYYGSESDFPIDLRTVAHYNRPPLHPNPWSCRDGGNEPVPYVVITGEEYCEE